MPKGKGTYGTKKGRPPKKKIYTGGSYVDTEEATSIPRPFILFENA